MLSMHSALRDRLRRKSLALDVTGLVGSVFVVAATLIDPAVAGLLSVTPESLKLGVALAGIAIFSASLIALRVDWAQAAHNHQEAARVLSEVKSRGRILGASDPSDEDISRFLELADARLAALPPIPDTSFVSLKAKHVRKVKLSRLLDERPGASVRLAGLRLRITDTWAVLRRPAPGPSLPTPEEHHEPEG